MANGLGNIPTLDAVDPGAVESAASGIGKAGSGIRQAGAELVSTWSRLHGVYRAPEAGELIGAMNPVRDQADRFGWEVGQVGAALSDYAAEIAPVKAKLAALKAAADTMLLAQAATPGGESHWRRKQSNVDAENKLLHDVAVALNQAHQIAAKCANRINGLIGGVQYHGGATPAGTPDAYWANDPSHLSWAAPVKKDEPWWKDGVNGVVGFGKGVVVDGGWGLVKGVGYMAGFGPKGWDWHNVWNSYKAIETLGAPLILPPALALPSVRKAWVNTGKDFIALGEWKKDKGRAAGKVVFNVVTLGVPETRLGLAGKAGDAALAVTRGVNKVDVVGHGLNLGIRAGAKGVSAGLDAMKNLRLGEGLTHLPKIRVQGLDRLPDTPTPKIDPGHFHTGEPKLSGAGHDVPHAKPTVRQLADHVENKISHGGRQPVRPEHEPTTAGGRQPAGHTDVGAHDGSGSRTPSRPPNRTDPSTSHDPSTTGGGHGGGDHGGGHPSGHDQGQGPDQGQQHDPGHQHDPGQDGSRGPAHHTTAAPQVHSTHIPGMVEDHGTYRFTTEEAAERYGEERLGDTWDRVLPEAQKRAVSEYTRFSWPYNPILRAREMGVDPQAVLDDMLAHPDDRYALRYTFGGKLPTLDDIYARVELIDRAASHPLPHAIETQRGLHDISFMEGFDGHDPHSVVGETQTEKGVMSTALGDEPPIIGGSKYSYRLHLDLPEGYPGLWLGKRSEYRLQRELVLPTGVRYTVTHVSRGSDGIWDLYAKVLP